nr:hypothetical protein [Micromonospora sp. DSM 115978]
MSTSSPEQASARRDERATARTGPGEAAPLGVHWDGHGVNVAVPAPGADSVSLCLFDRQGRETRVPLPERDGGVWHGYVADVGPGQRYGLRADGPYSPERGLRYNPAKLLVDPYARCVRGGLLPHPAVFGYAGGDPYSTTPDARDSAPYVPFCEVVAPADPHAPDPTANRPATPWPDTVVYELHVKGFT